MFDQINSPSIETRPPNPKEFDQLWNWPTTLLIRFELLEFILCCIVWVDFTDVFPYDICLFVGHLHQEKITILISTVSCLIHAHK